MPKIRFTQNIQRHVSCPDENLTGSNVEEVLKTYFAKHPDARGYVLDDQGRLRKHMAIFVDGSHIQDPSAQSDPVGPDSIIDVLQALSGG